MKIKFRTLTEKENQEVIKKIADVLNNKNLSFAGKHRQNDWQNGWQENLNEDKFVLIRPFKHSRSIEFSIKSFITFHFFLPKYWNSNLPETIL
jgi:hypothetical protein